MYFEKDVWHSVWFRIFFTLMSVFQEIGVTECLVSNYFQTNFRILRKTPDTIYGLGWLLQ